MPDFVTSLVLPIALGAMMFSIGSTLTVADFARILVAPRAICAGLFSLLLLVPVLGFAVASLSGAPPLYALGLFLVATCPSGTFSNLLTLHGGGDLALSVSMSAIGGLVYAVLAPFWTAFGLYAFADSMQVVPLSFLDAFRDLLSILVLPTCAGVALHRLAPRSAARMRAPLQAVLTLLIPGIFLALLYAERAQLAAMLAIVPQVLVLNLLTVALGWLVAARMRLPERQITAIACEHAIRQEGTGIYVATALLALPAASVPLVLNSFIGFFVGCSFIALRRFVLH